jgi:serine protease Do
MKRWVTFVAAAGCLLLGGLVLGSRGVRAEEEGGEGVEKKIEKKIQIVRAGGGAFLGVRLEDVEGALRGATVGSVEPESAAEKAGLEKGDVITRFDGVDVRSAQQLARVVRETPPGREVQIEVDRGGATKTLTATLDKGRRRIQIGEGGLFLPELEDEDFDVEIDPAMPHPPVGPMPHVYRWHGDDEGDFAMSWLPMRPRLGVYVMDIEGQLADYFRLEADRGVLVSSVKEDGPAARAGIRAGDVVLELDGTPIRTSRDLRRQVRRAEGGAVAVKVLRDGKPLEVQVTLPEADTPKRVEPATGVSL